MKKVYIVPVVDVLELELVDVILNSNIFGTDDSVDYDFGGINPNDNIIE